MKKIVVSYGGGVQSRALGRKIADGEFPCPDLIIFADTGAEPIGIYEAVEVDKKFFAEAGIRFEVVQYGDLLKLKPGKKLPWYTHLPLFTARFAIWWDDVLEKFFPFVKKGMMHRTCTSRYKIEPIQKRLKQLGWNKGDGVELWLGISTDEVQRMNVSRVDWITNAYPLIEYNYSRTQLEDYLRELGITPVKSACVMCPYRSAENWREVKNVPEDWEKAVAYDESIREISPGSLSFVHGSRTPLKTAVDNGDSIPGLADDECAGICMT